MTADKQCFEQGLLSELRSVRISRFVGDGLTLGAMVGLLMLTSVLNGYMNVFGLMCILPTIKPIAIVLGIVIELGKLTLIAILHTHWASNNRAYRRFFIAGAILFTSLTFVDAFGYLSFSHSQSAEGLSKLAVAQDTLDQEASLLRNQMQKIDKTLAGLPENHVSRQLKLREQYGYYQIQARLVKIVRLRADLSQQQISSQTQSGPIFNNARMLGVNEEAASFGYLFMLCIATETASIGALIAIIKFSKANNENSIREFSLEMAKASETQQLSSFSSHTEKKSKKKVKNIAASKNNQVLAKMVKMAKVDVDNHQRHQKLVEIVERYGLTESELAKITGRKREHTVRSWIQGGTAIPEKAMREVLRYVENQTPVVKKIRARN